MILSRAASTNPLNGTTAAAATANARASIARRDCVFATPPPNGPLQRSDVGSDVQLFSNGITSTD